MHWQTSELLPPLFQRSRIGVVTDFDGTVSHINPDRHAPSLSPRNHELLSTLTERLPLVSVISGRTLDDLRGRIPIPNVVFVGSHGLERLVDGQVVLVPEAQESVEAIQQVLSQLDLQPGMAVEDKGVTVSIHYRTAPDTDAIFQTFDPLLRQLAAQYHLDYFNGKMIFELRPPLDVNKGTALRDLVAEYKLDGVIFMGDDVTDADGMRVAQELRQAGDCYALALAVESHDMPKVVRDHADLLAKDIPDVEAFLSHLLTSIS